MTLAMTGCSEHDYGYTVDYNVVNRTEFDIVIYNGKSKLTIQSGEAQTVHQTSGLCEKDAIITDNFGDLLYLSGYSMNLDGEMISSEIFERKYLVFESEVYHATYTLTVTEELLQSLESDL